MTEEIKEIIDYLIDEECTRRIKCITIEESKQLLDYITNLQQENEKLKEYIKMYKCDYSPLYKELKQSLFKSANNTNKAMEQTEIYKSKCEKAIEYIDNVEISYCRKGFLEDGILISKHVIKNILEGSDNNE